jgi:hypothetical protein
MDLCGPPTRQWARSVRQVDSSAILAAAPSFDARQWRMLIDNKGKEMLRFVRRDGSIASEFER